MSGFEPQPPPLGHAPVQRPGNGLAVAALVLGLIAIVLFCFWWVSIPCAVLAIIFGALGKGKANRGASGGGMAIAGIVLGIIALALAIFVVAGVLAMLGLGTNESFWQGFQKGFEGAQQGSSSF
jgi:hypothetical protein